MISRREWLRITASGLALGTASTSRLLALAPAKEATVYKAATCGCCKKWVNYNGNRRGLRPSFLTAAGS